MKFTCRFRYKGEWVNRFPTLNEYINVERGHRIAAANLKKDVTEQVAYQCIGQKKIEGKVNLWLKWHVSGKHDPDNVYFAVKFILDGMVKAHMLPNDNQTYINEIHHSMVRDSQEFVELLIIK